MDVGKYISELLVLNAEVSVPGLGYFAHTRVNGHYNQTEEKLYPPSYTVQFDPQLIEDEILSEYVADKKNISLASAKYFTEKYINNIKLLAQTQETALADIGWFSAAGNKLYFKPNAAYNAHPGLFGYAPVQIQKIGTTLAHGNLTVNSAPVKDELLEVNATPQNGTIWTETSREDEEYLINLTKKRKRGLTVVFIVLGILFTALIVYLADRYDPTIFNLEAPKPKAREKGTVINAKVQPVKDTVARDTAKTAAQVDSSLQKPAPVNTDTLTKTSATVKDSVAGPRYEVMGGSFRDAKEANKAIANYRTLKIEARVVSDAPGRRVKLTLGTFKTRAEAEAARKALIATKKVNKDIYTLEIKPKL